jgi:hypothetical protein
MSGISPDNGGSKYCRSVSFYRVYTEQCPTRQAVFSCIKLIRAVVIRGVG